MRFELMTKVGEWVDDSEVYQKMDKFQKEKYKKEMLDNAERLLRAKYDQRHKKKIDKLRKYSSPKFDY